jgi:hypothetical protein
MGLEDEMKALGRKSLTMPKPEQPEMADLVEKQKRESG